MTIAVSVAVQHHPRRARLLPGLLARLDGLPIDVASDPEPDAAPSAWRTYRHALETTPGWATHRLIVQDDTEPCPWFPEVAAAAIAARPDRPIVFFHASQPADNALRIRVAAHKGLPFAELNPQRWVPVVALSWPAPLIRPALDFAASQKWPEAFQADDEIVARCYRHLRVQTLATVPSLVEHPDREMSLLGLRARAGRDRSRVAFCWVGDCDARTIDWQGPDESPR